MQGAGTCLPACLPAWHLAMQLSCRQCPAAACRLAPRRCRSQPPPRHASWRAAGFAQFFLWLLSPFVTRRKTFSASVVLKRVLVVLVSCQVLRILSFLSTQLPAPAPHCRAPEPTSNVLWPVVRWGRRGGLGRGAGGPGEGRRCL